MAVGELEQLRLENEELRARLAADPYDKIEELGEGGSCTVWRAVQRVDHRHFIEVSLKELKPHLREDPDSVRYFLREARIASNLRHGNIVLLLGVDEARYRLVYELVDGVDLRRLLEHAGGRLAADLVTLVGLEIAEALEYAHSRTKEDAPAGVVHRDLKPANVLVSVAGQVMLADFGVAAIESTELQTSVRGTAAYMSPEQARGMAVDARTDLFSLGVVLYELLAGRRPFDGDGEGPASLERLGRGTYPALELLVPDAPSELVAIIARLLRATRDERFQNAREVATALSALAPSHDVKRELGERAARARRRKTKNYRTLQLAHEARHDGVEHARVPGAHEVTALLRAVHGGFGIAAGRAAVRPATRVWGVATLVATLTATMFLVSRSQSSTAREVVLADEVDARPVTALPLSSVAPPSIESAEPSAVGSGGSLSVAEEGVTRAEATAVGGVADPAGPGALPESVPVPESGGAAALASVSSAGSTEPAPAEATLRVSADKSAPVQIDGRFVGWSPLRASVAPGAHIIVVGEGVRQQTIRTRVAAGSTKNVFVHIRRRRSDE